MFFKLPKCYFSEFFNVSVSFYAYNLVEKYNIYAKILYAEVIIPSLLLQQINS